MIKNSIHHRMDSIQDTIMSFMPEQGSMIRTYGILAVTVAAVCSFYVAAYICISRFVGSGTRWVDVHPQVSTIWSYNLPAALLLFIAAFLYFRIEPEGIVYFIFGMVCIAFALSYSAMAISSIRKN